MFLLANGLLLNIALFYRGLVNENEDENSDFLSIYLVYEFCYLLFMTSYYIINRKSINYFTFNLAT